MMHDTELPEVRRVVDSPFRLIVNHRDEILHVSRALLQETGYTNERLLGLPLSMLLCDAHALPGEKDQQATPDRRINSHSANQNIFQGTIKLSDRRCVDAQWLIIKTHIGPEPIALVFCQFLPDADAGANAIENVSAETPESALFYAAVDGIIAINESGTILSFNPAASRLFEYSTADVIGENVSVLMPSPDRENHDQYIRNYHDTKQAKIIGIGRNVRGRKKSGVTFPMHLSVGEATTGKNKTFIGICHDLTETYQLRDNLKEAENRFREIVETQTEWVCRIDSDLNINFSNPSMTAGVGYPQGITGRHFLDLLHNESRELVRHCLLDLFTAGKGRPYTTLRLRTGRSELLIEWRFERSESSLYGTEIQALGLDVTGREDAENRARFFRDHDPVTGLITKRRALALCEGDEWINQSLGIIVIKLLNFSSYKQIFSHRKIDALLIEVAARISEKVPKTAVLAHADSNEFLVILEKQFVATVSQMARSISDFITQTITVGNSDFVLRAATCIATVPDDEETLEEAVRNAEAMLRHPCTEKNVVNYYNADRLFELSRLIDIEHSLKQAITGNELDVYLQKKTEALTGLTVGYEALLRWNKNGTFIPPDEFVTVAEKTGLSQSLDNYVLTEVIKQVALSTGPTAEKALPIAVNITASSFMDTELCSFILATLAEWQMNSGILELEITERVVVANSDVVKNNIRTLRENGIRIAIDDFGTGFSSLGYLSQIDLDTIKIDKLFIDSINEEKGWQLLKAIKSLADSMGINLLAEGVEKPEQVETLLDIGINTCQGYYFHRPEMMSGIMVPS